MKQIADPVKKSLNYDEIVSYTNQMGKPNQTLHNQSDSSQWSECRQFLQENPKIMVSLMPSSTSDLRSVSCTGVYSNRKSRYGLTESASQKVTAFDYKKLPSVYGDTSEKCVLAQSRANKNLPDSPAMSISLRPRTALTTNEVHKQAKIDFRSQLASQELIQYNINLRRQQRKVTVKPALVRSKSGLRRSIKSVMKYIKV